MDLADLPQELRQRLLSIASNHPFTSAVDLFNMIPSNLRDSVSEIDYWVNTHEWSHVIPKSMGGIEAVWETKVGHPNQVRGDQPMTIQEVMQIQEQNFFDSQSVEAMYTDDISPESFDRSATTHIHEWTGSLDQALIGAGLVGLSGYAVTFAFRVARNVIAHRGHLIKSREFRKSFLLKTLQQAHSQGVRAGALSFVISFICIIFPPFQFILYSGAIVGMGRLGLEILCSIIRHVDPDGSSIFSKVFNFAREAFNFAASVLANLWIVINTAVDWILEGLSKIANALLKVGRKVFDTVGLMMDWLLGAPTIVSDY
jgi:hypothetical protein